MFHLVSYCLVYENQIYTTIRGSFKRIGKVSAGNTKYAEHYTSYGYSFRIYGNFEEILK